LKNAKTLDKSHTDKLGGVLYEVFDEVDGEQLNWQE